MIAVSAFQHDDFLARAAERLRREPPGRFEPHRIPPGDHQDPEEAAAMVSQRPPRMAAVLIPIVLHESEPTVILTKRHDALPTHAGQIAFPGGKIDEGDLSPLDAALRETEEEIGLDRVHVRPIGYLDAYLSSSNFLVIPSVATVTPGVSLSLNPSEVDDAFEVPLGFLMNAANHAIHSREWQGRQRSYYAMPFGERYIWGMTAGILRNMYERLYGP
jgi:8-oxo-dGTP pyrophosphatase MutT (NUDIX family)